MQVLGMNHGILTISLTGDDCAALANCLQAATEAGAFDLAGQETAGTLCEALASAFAMAALASTSHNWIALRNHDDLAADLEAVGLGHLLASDPLSLPKGKGGGDVLEQAARAIG